MNILAAVLTACSLNKEFKQRRESTKSGVGADDVYKPKFWLYDSLKFIKDGGCDLRLSRSTLPASNDDIAIEENITIVENPEVDQPSCSPICVICEELI